jgi:hypothetical protein
MWLAFAKWVCAQGRNIASGWGSVSTLQVELRRLFGVARSVGVGE